MRKRLVAGLVPIVLAASFSALPTASAATQIGDPCAANYAIDETTIFQRASPSTGLPTAAPSGGVITRWAINVGSTSATIPQVMKVVRVLGPTTAQTVAESAQEMVIAGYNQFATRLPIAAGDWLGLFGAGETGTLVCDAPITVADRVGYFTGSPPTGALSSFAEVAKQRLPVVATIEPDVDGDGYGDESQDLCTQSAAAHEACPPIALAARTGAKGSNAVTVTVSSDNPAAVLVRGVASLGKGRRATLKAGPKTVLPGRPATFRLRFNKALKGKLEALAPGKKLTLRIAAEATNIAGQRSVDTLKAKLKGQG